MSLISGIKNAGSALVHKADQIGDNLTKGAKNFGTKVAADVKTAGSVIDKGLDKVGDGLHTLGTGAKVVGTTTAAATQIGAHAAVETVKMQASMTRFALQKTADAAIGGIKNFALNRVGTSNPPAAQGLTFAETKSATTLAYDAKQNDVYRFPDGKQWKVVDVSEDAKSGFRAIALKPTDPTDKRTVVSFAGTDPKSGKDWWTDVRQEVGIQTRQYDLAANFAAKWKGQAGGDTILTGHSLGGGLASYASIKTGLRATALNSAPLSPKSLGGNPFSPSVRNNPRITQYYVPSEILTDVDKLNPFSIRPGNQIPVQGKYPTVTFDPASDLIFSGLNHMGGSAVPGIPAPVFVGNYK